MQSLTRPIAVVCVFGLPRIGKSFIAGNVVGQSSSFTAGNPTKGIWTWNPIKVVQKNEFGGDKEVDLVVLDCQGINSIDNYSLSLQLASLAVLLSSHLVLVR